METKKHYFDYGLLAIVIFLMCFGLVMLYSASSYSAQIENNNSMYYFLRQLIFCVGGFAVMLFVGKIDYHRLAKLSKWIYFIAFGLMALVQTPLGKTVNGARRWLRLPMGFTMQPSETMKVAIVLFVPFLICQAGKKIQKKEVLFKIIAWGVAAALGVYLLTDNLSTAIIVLGIVCVMIFVAVCNSDIKSISSQERN